MYSVLGCFQKIKIAGNFAKDYSRDRKSSGADCQWPARGCTVKNRLAVFMSPGGMPLTKLSLARNNLIIPARESLVSDIPAGDGKTSNLFLQCGAYWILKLRHVIFFCPQIANFGRIPLLQIHKFIRCPSQLIVNPRI